MYLGFGRLADTYWTYCRTRSRIASWMCEGRNDQAEITSERCSFSGFSQITPLLTPPDFADCSKPLLLQGLTSTVSNPLSSVLCFKQSLRHCKFLVKFHQKQRRCAGNLAALPNEREPRKFSRHVVINLC